MGMKTLTHLYWIEESPEDAQNHLTIFAATLWVG